MSGAGNDRLTSLLPSNIKGGLLINPKSNDDNVMPPPPPRRQSDNDDSGTGGRAVSGGRNYRKRRMEDETPSHIGINRQVERKVRDREGRVRRRDRTGDSSTRRRRSRSDYSDSDDDSRGDGGGRKGRSRSRSRRSKRHGSSSGRKRKSSKRRSSRSSSSSSSDRTTSSSSRSRSRERDRKYERHSNRRKDDRDYERERSHSNRRHGGSSNRYPSSRKHNDDEKGRDAKNREDVIYASTPLIHKNNNNSQRVQQQRSNHHQTSNYKNSNRSSWENETPMHSTNRSKDATEDIIKRSTMSYSSAAVVSRGSRSRSRNHINTNSSSVRHYPGHGGETPMISSSKINDQSAATDNDSNNDNITTNQDELDDEFDRQFYLADDEDYNIQENNNGGDGNNQMGRFLYESKKTKAREEEMERKKQTHGNAGSMTTMRDARRNALRDDQEAWEENRLLSSGAAVRGDVDLDTLMKSNEDDSRVTLLVHQVKPPFLKDGASAFSKVRTAVPTVKDNTSDFAKMAREGSVTLKTIRENRDKNAMRQKFWELGGTRMGNVVGVNEKKKEDDDSPSDPTAVEPTKDEGDTNAEENRANESVQENVQGEVDYKKSSGFAAHVTTKKDSDGPVSDFARKKSIREQREYLPAFTIRDELLNVIRENNIVIVVGETGSG